jgi:restriction system protein
VVARKKDSLVEMLILLPWWVSVAFAVIAWVALKVVAPAIAAQDVALRPFASIASGVAPVVGSLLLVSAALSAVRGLGTRRALESQSGLDSLREIPWKQFEDLVAEAYRRKGCAVEENLGKGPDGGIDLILRKGGRKTLVQCKRWKGKTVGAPVVRELYGLMNAECADEGKLVATSSFSPDARNFAAGKAIELVDGNALLALVGEVQTSGCIAEAVSSRSPDASEKSCPACGRQMVLRTARRGTNAGGQFWGCSGYPDCTRTLPA